MPVSKKSLANLKPAWKPGQCGNPSGRGVLEGMVRKALESNDNEKLSTLIDTLYAEGTIGSARAGKDGEVYYVKNMEAIKILFERGYGKSVQPIEGNIGATITLADAIDALINSKKDE